MCSYDIIEPMATWLALVSAMNVFSNSGNYRTGALPSFLLVFLGFLKVSNATCWSGPHSKCISFYSKCIIGVAI